LGGVPIDYRNQGFVARIMELTGDGVDLVVDPIGRENLDRPFRTLRKGGQLVSTAALSKMMGDMTTIRVLMGLLQLQPARRAQELLLGGIVQEKLLRIPSRAEPATTPNPGPKPRDHATPERSLRPALSVLW
jgi:NADPH:quinone reductase-like Zn-dependent oxidoreductase